MSNGRYGGKSTNASTDAEIAELRADLKNQGDNITKIVNKIDVISESVTTMTVQMGHLVTRESCAEGRALLARDIKNRMDSKRDITGVDLPIKDLVKEYVKQNKPTPVPYKAKPSISSATLKAMTERSEKKDRGFTFWVGLISGILAIVAAVYGTSTFIDRTLQRQDRTDHILLQLQQKIEENTANAAQKTTLANEKSPR